jgi:hypothetical protein
VNKILEAGWHFVEGFLSDDNIDNDSYGDESFGAEFSVDHVLNSDQEKNSLVINIIANYFKLFKTY